MEGQAPADTVQAAGRGDRDRTATRKGSQVTRHPPWMNIRFGEFAALRRGHSGRTEVGRSVAGRLAGLALLAGPPYSARQSHQNRVRIVRGGVDRVKGPAKDAPGERNANPEVMDA